MKVYTPNCPPGTGPTFSPRPCSMALIVFINHENYASKANDEGLKDQQYFSSLAKLKKSDNHQDSNLLLKRGGIKL